MELDDLLFKWQQAKEQKILYEKQCEKYRTSVEKYMSKKNISTIDTKNYILSRKDTTRQQLTKKDVPIDIYNRYASRITYSTYHVKEKKDA